MSNTQKDHDTHIYDMLIIGGGPAGYTAALYAARAGLDAIVLEKLSAGGQMAQTEQIDNYPGFEDGILGFSLGEKMKKGAERFGVKTQFTEVLSLELRDTVKKAETQSGIFFGKTVVFATGASPRELGLANERELIGRGVSYCASCDGMFFRGKRVVVVGGGNSAAENALLLSRICEQVTLINRADTLQASKIYHTPLMQASNITVYPNSTVTEIIADNMVSAVRMRNLKTGEVREIPCGGVFVSVGREPATWLIKDTLTLNAAGYIVADESTCTNIKGFFAVGDVRTKEVRQVVTAVADGAVAVHYAEEYLAESDPDFAS